MTAPLKKKFNWGDVGVGTAFAGLTSSLGFAASAIVLGREKNKGGLDHLLPVLIPSVGAGILGYWIRRECAPCLRASDQRASGQVREQQALIGYGAVQMFQPTTFTFAPETEEVGWIMEAKAALGELGYSPGDSSELDSAFNDAVMGFQSASGLAPTGWIDVETAAALAAATGRSIATISPDGIGLEDHNPAAVAEEEKPKQTRWGLILGGIGVGAAAVTATVLGVASASKKR